ncbi:MAG: protein kinase domain-containing protein, partial [Jatrophihabitantaceae bacterium]
MTLGAGRLLHHTRFGTRGTGRVQLGGHRCAPSLTATDRLRPSSHAPPTIPRRRAENRARTLSGAVEDSPTHRRSARRISTGCCVRPGWPPRCDIRRSWRSTTCWWPTASATSSWSTCPGSLARRAVARRRPAPGRAGGADHRRRGVRAGGGAPDRRGAPRRQPANIFLEADGSAKLGDFGIARVSGDVSVTATGMMFGTVAYMAPEVARGAPATSASDVWSLGISLYAALQGVTRSRRRTPSVCWRGSPPNQLRRRVPPARCARWLTAVARGAAAAGLE